MKLSEFGESRVRGYLYVLERSLRTFLPREVVADAVREVESHIRERLDQIDPSPDEHAALERVLRELGPPLQVAQAYSLEMTVDEAVATGRVTSMARAFWHVATTTLGGFLAAAIVLWGYLAGAILIVTAAIKPFLPQHVVFTFKYVVPIIRVSYPDVPGGVDQGGYWVIPFALLCGLGILTGTQRGARGWLAWWIERRRLMQLRLINVAPEGDAVETR
jgi:uncharacterized membrane protein